MQEEILRKVFSGIFLAKISPFSWNPPISLVIYHLLLESTSFSWSDWVWVSLLWLPGPIVPLFFWKNRCFLKRLGLDCWFPGSQIQKSSSFCSNQAFFVPRLFAPLFQAQNPAKIMFFHEFSLFFSVFLYLNLLFNVLRPKSTVQAKNPLVSLQFPQIKTGSKLYLGVRFRTFLFLK